MWQKVTNKNIQISGERKIIPQITSFLQLDDVAFKQLQPSIPSEESGRFVIFALPTPDGTTKDFKVFESVCMEPALAAKYPMIKTYQAISVDDASVTAKLDYTEFGFHAMVFAKEGVYFIDPYSNINSSYYNCYYKKFYTRQTAQYAPCQTETLTEKIANQTNSNSLIGSNNQSTGSDNLIVPDGKRRIFRLALSCTIEYSAAVASPGPTKARVLAAMVTSMNRVNGVFEKDLSIHMNLVANNDTLIFITSDNFSNNNGGAMLGQNQTVCDARIGNANYDIGHVFSTGGGGVAGLGVICVTGDKANGVTGSGTPVGDGFDIDYVAHEMGHQYGANHTFNAGTGACGGNRAGNAAYEPGSATTIMGYAGICDVNDIALHSDDYFHRKSIEEMYTYISSTSCAVIPANSNTPPTVANYAATFNIPYKTSFEITTSATDAENHPLNYCWEEYDLGPQGNWNVANNTTAPLFRSFLPTVSGTRVFPVWDSLINNSIKYKGEVLPEVARNIKFRCTVRDNDNGYGAFNAPNTDLLLKSVVTPTLFRVTSFPTASAFNGNTTQTINWDVANTTASPISCSNVDIYLSLDSARTFPYLLASNVANDGTESVLIPDVVTANASARIKVKGHGNVFFDLNNGWIKINQGIPPVVSKFTASDSVICEGTSITFTNTSTGPVDSVRWSINGGSPSTSISLTTVASTFNNSGFFNISIIAYKAGIASAAFNKTIQVKPTPTFVFTPTAPTTCAGDSIEITADYLLGATCIWSTGSPNQTIKVAPLVNTYYSVTVTNDGCTAVDSVLVTVKPTATTNLSSTICSNENYTIGNQTFNTEGLHTVVLQTTQGCDSTVNLTLTVNPTKTTDIAQTICSNGSVTVGTQTFNTAGLHTVVLQTSTGCDSTVNLTLTVNPTKTTDIAQTICSNGSVTIGNQTFNTDGLHTVVLQTSEGCDSTVNLTLTVNPTKTTDIEQTICSNGSVTVGNQTFNTEGLHTVMLQTSTGCDSTVNLTLTVNPTKTTDIAQTICSNESVTIGNQTFNTDGLHTVVLQTSFGCDSTVNLTLTVEQLPAKPSISQSHDTLFSNVIVAGATYNWYLNGDLVAATTVPFYKFTVNNIYTVKIITTNCESELSATYNASLPTGIKSNKLDISFAIYPNPNNGFFDIKITALKSAKYDLTLYNVTGQEILKDELNIQQGENVKRFNLNDVAKGMYFITLKNEDGISTQNIIVQ